MYIRLRGKLLSAGTLPGYVVINQCWRLRQCALIILIIHVYHYDLFMLIVMSYQAHQGCAERASFDVS